MYHTLCTFPEKTIKITTWACTSKQQQISFINQESKLIFLCTVWQVFLDQLLSWSHISWSTWTCLCNKHFQQSQPKEERSTLTLDLWSNYKSTNTFWVEPGFKVFRGKIAIPLPALLVAIISEDRVRTNMVNLLLITNTKKRKNMEFTIQEKRVIFYQRSTILSTNQLWVWVWTIVTWINIVSMQREDLLRVDTIDQCNHLPTLPITLRHLE